MREEPLRSALPAPPLPLRVALVALLAAWVVSSAQPLLTLEEAVAMGLKNNHSISLARDEREIAANNRSLGRGLFLPDLSASASQNGYFERDEPVNALGTSLNWTIFDGLESYHAYGRLKTLEDAGLLREKAAVESALERIMGAYYGIVREKQDLEALRELLKVSQERAAMARARQEVGSGSRLEQLQALSDLNGDSSAVLRQEARLQAAKAHLNSLLAREVKTDFDVTDSIPLDEALAPDSLEASLAGDNSVLRLARLDLRAAEQVLRESRAGWLPRVTASLSYYGAPEALNRGDPEPIRPEGLGWSLNATVPLFDRFNTLRRSRNARIGARQSGTRLREAEKLIEADFSAARARHAAGLQRVRLEEDNLEVARLQAEAAQERFRLGTGTYLEFRDAQRRQLESRSRFIAARYETKLAEVELKRLGGELVRAER